MKRNITLSPDVDLIRKARVISARRMVSVSQLLSNEVTRIIEEDEGYEENRKLALSPRHRISSWRHHHRNKGRTS
jgi:hypothetical protein